MISLKDAENYKQEFFVQIKKLFNKYATGILNLYSYNEGTTTYFGDPYISIQKKDKNGNWRGLTIFLHTRPLATNLLYNVEITIEKNIEDSALNAIMNAIVLDNRDGATTVHTQLNETERYDSGKNLEYYIREEINK